MPLYEYQCESCQHRFEKIRKFSDPPLEACPVCNGPVRKLPSSPAIQFKGSGWYINDYAKKSSSEGSQAAGAKDKPGSDGKDKGESGGAQDSNRKSDSGDAKSSETKSAGSSASDAKSSDSKSTPSSGETSKP